MSSIQTAGAAGSVNAKPSYMSKKSSHTVLFSAPNPADAVVLDTPTLIRLLPPRLRDTLRDNDHVFGEGSRVEGATLILGVWGYGLHDANAFRWKCAYGVPRVPSPVKKIRPATSR